MGVKFVWFVDLLIGYVKTWKHSRWLWWKISKFTVDMEFDFPDTFQII